MVTPFTMTARSTSTAPPRWPAGSRSRATRGSCVAGTTGEAPTLTDDEKLTLWEAVAEAVTIPVVAGSGTNDTAHSVHLTAEASKLGVAGILALCPYYNRPSQAGIEGHLRAIAEATDLPVDHLRHPGPHRAQDRRRALLVRLAHEVRQHRRRQGRRRQPGRDGRG